MRGPVEEISEVHPGMSRIVANLRDIPAGHREDRELHTRPAGRRVRWILVQNGEDGRTIFRGE